MRKIIAGMIQSYPESSRPSISVTCLGRMKWQLQARNSKSYGPANCILKALRSGWPQYQFNLSAEVG